MAKSGSQVARDAGLDPKEFRRYLRSVPSWNNPGTGKRYQFNDKDEATALKGYKAWKASRQPVTRAKKVEG